MTPLLFFMHLPGDVATLGPVLAAARVRNTPVRLAMPAAFWDRSAPARTLCDWLHIVPIRLPDSAPVADSLPELLPCHVLVTGSETTLKPHRAAHDLTLALRAEGARAFTLQHGLENVGISYFDHIQGPEVRFAADEILIWGNTARLPPNAPAENVAKTKTVGRPRYAGAGPPTRPLPAAAPAAFDIVLFENLHWHRFDDAYRANLLRDVQRLADARRDLSIIIKPHPQGRWLTQRFKGERPAASNLVIADPADPAWADLDIAAFIARARAILTTPSTTALDAAQEGKPTAIFAYGLDLPLYAPLPMLQGGDLEPFIDEALNAPDSLAPLTQALVAASIAPGDAAERILDLLSTS